MISGVDGFSGAGHPMRVLGTIGIGWGLGGFLALLGSAMVRLTPMAAEAIQQPSLHPIHWAALGVWTAFMLYTEAYRGFHLAFAPRFGARMRHLFEHPSWWHVLLAPAYGMCLIHATPHRKRVAWGLVAAILCLVAAVRHVAQPWRGIIDFGVVLGLAAGAMSTVYFTVRAFVDVAFTHPCEVPETA